MNRLARSTLKYAVSFLSFITVASGHAIAQIYYSPAPIPPRINRFDNLNYIISSTEGTRFYFADPYYSQVTTDGNLFISSALIQQDRNYTLGTYIQIDCGRKAYRDLVPWFEIDRYGYERLMNPTTYNWTYFKLGSAFKLIGKYLCTSAARDRGLNRYTTVW